MPIINGKKRYIQEEPSGEAGANPVRRAPWVGNEAAAPSEPAPAVQKKRYQRAIVEEKPERVIKHYERGSGSLLKDINDFVGGYEFSVKFSIGDINFSKVANLGSSIEVGTFVEGGNNDYPMIFKTPRRRPDVLVLEKGVPGSALTGVLLSRLKEGVKLAAILIFVKKNGSIVKTFSITEGIIVSRRYSTLDANSSEIFVEQLEIAHTGITEV